MTAVRIPWNREFNNEKRWNEVCTWAIEYFGLPGNRFTTDTNIEYIDFIFKNKHDALLMAIQWSVQIVEINEYET
jgi:hypothetical protein